MALLFEKTDARRVMFAPSTAPPTKLEKLSANVVWEMVAALAPLTEIAPPWPELLVPSTRFAEKVLFVTVTGLLSTTHRPPAKRAPRFALNVESLMAVCAARYSMTAPASRPETLPVNVLRVIVSRPAWCRRAPAASGALLLWNTQSSTSSPWSGG